jgi:uncharacterized membrane protein
MAALVAALIMPQHSVTAARLGGTITDLGTLGGDHSEAVGINNDPAIVHVVGWSLTVSDVAHAFVSRRGHAVLWRLQ